MISDYVREWLDGHWQCLHRVEQEGSHSIRITCARHNEGAGDDGQTGDAVIVRDYLFR